MTVTSPRVASRTYAITGSCGLGEDGSWTTRAVSSDSAAATGAPIAAVPAAAAAEAFRNDRRVSPRSSWLSSLIPAPLRLAPNANLIRNGQRTDYAVGRTLDHCGVIRTSMRLRAAGSLRCDPDPIGWRRGLSREDPRVLPRHVVSTKERSLDAGSFRQSIPPGDPAGGATGSLRRQAAAGDGP